MNYLVSSWIPRAVSENETSDVLINCLHGFPNQWTMSVCCQACCHSERIKIPVDLTKQSNLFKVNKYTWPIYTFFSRQIFYFKVLLFPNFSFLLNANYYWIKFLQNHPDIRVSTFYKEAAEGKFIGYLSDDAKTLYETFRKGAKVSGKCFSEDLVRYIQSKSGFLFL